MLPTAKAFTRKEIYEALHPEAKQGGLPGKSGSGKQAKNEIISSFAADTAAKTGVTERTVQPSSLTKAAEARQAHRKALSRRVDGAGHSLHLRPSCVAQNGVYEGHLLANKAGAFGALRGGWGFIMTLCV